MSNQSAVGTRVLIVASSLITAIGGFAAGVLVAMSLGLHLHDNYEFYGIGTAAGNLLIFGGAGIGLAIPWIIGRAIKRLRS